MRGGPKPGGEKTWPINSSPWNGDWYLGSVRNLRQELLSAASGRLRATHCGAERREAQEANANRLVREEMGRMGWDQATLRQARKGDQRKVRVAARLRKETTMSLKWIAQRLEMGSWTYVSNLLGAKRKEESLKSEN